MIRLNSDEPQGLAQTVEDFLKSAAKAGIGVVVFAVPKKKPALDPLPPTSHAPNEQGTPLGTYDPSDLANFCKQPLTDTEPPPNNA